jgi:hypothetical protein
MMEAARTFETLVNFYRNTRRFNPEDSHLRTQRRENLKYYTINHTIPFEIFWYILPLFSTLEASFKVVNKPCARVNHLPAKWP